MTQTSFFNWIHDTNCRDCLLRLLAILEKCRLHRCLSQKKEDGFGKSLHGPTKRHCTIVGAVKTIAVAVRLTFRTLSPDENILYGSLSCYWYAPVKGCRGAKREYHEKSNGYEYRLSHEYDSPTLGAKREYHEK